MPRRNSPISAETTRFHKLVAEGTLDELQKALDGAAINAPGVMGQTALTLAIEAKDLEKARLLVDRGADLELTDDFNRTALRYAVADDFAEGVRYLLGLGVERGYAPKYPLKIVRYEGLGAGLGKELEEMADEVRKSLEEMDVTPTMPPVISDVQSLAVLKLFLEAGDELGLAPRELKRELLGLATEGEVGRDTTGDSGGLKPTLRTGAADYRAQKSPRYGTRNPERMELAFWKEMVRTGLPAYAARVQFDDNEPFKRPGAVWCDERFGTSLTPLEDGRYVQIGGEHEDYYDPDFNIYNDVIVHDGHGDFQIYGYPKDVFPPTDSHSATLCPQGIYIIGCLGYPEQREPGSTPVYRLTLDAWEIEPIATTGDNPGWIYSHRARFDRERNSIRIVGGKVVVPSDERETQPVPNEEEFELDLVRRVWRKAGAGG